MPYLPYLKDIDLVNCVREVLTKTQTAYDNADKQLYSNIIDPFSALFDAARQNILFNDWLEQERSRQVQKTLQNAVGNFHQNILGNIKGWDNPGKGGGYDLINHQKKCIAEVKNKFNTMNSSAAESTYRKMSNYIDKQYKGYTAYIVFIVPKYAKDYDVPWSPNLQTMPNRPDIRKADGESFYAYASGIPDALEMLYDCLPQVISDILGTEQINNEQKISLKKLFLSVYK